MLPTLQRQLLRSVGIFGKNFVLKSIKNIFIPGPPAASSCVPKSKFAHSRLIGRNNKICYSSSSSSSSSANSNNNSPGFMESISVQDLHQHMSMHKDSAQFVDCREQGETQLAFIPGFTNMPMSRFNEWELDKEKAVYVLCHHGVRSRMVGQRLIAMGFSKVFNIEGGIDAYAEKVDKSVGIY